MSYRIEYRVTFPKVVHDAPASLSELDHRDFRACTYVQADSAPEAVREMGDTLEDVHVIDISEHKAGPRCPKGSRMWPHLVRRFIRTPAGWLFVDSVDGTPKKDCTTS